MIKLVVCDMDGTMIGHDEALAADTAEWITRLEQNHIMFSVATGRSEGYMRTKVQEMGLFHPYIVTNGATIMEGERAIVRRQFAIKPFQPVAEMAKALGMSAVYTLNGEERIEYETTWTAYEAQKRGVSYNPEPFSETEWLSLKADKILIMDPVRQGAINDIEKLINKIEMDAAYVRYRDKAVELNEKTSNKAAALKELAAMLGIGLEEILVIGDDDNDIEMFRAAGVSAAVANASPKAREAAAYVCSNKEFDGVKEAITRFCFNNELV